MASNSSRDYTIRPMKEEEIEETYELVDKEGWNLTLDKFTHLYHSCPKAFYVAATDQGEIVGTISFFPTFPKEYVLGNIVIKSTYRHKGMGKKLVDVMMEQHSPCVVSCTAVPGADQFYINVGFSFTEPQQGHDIFHIEINREELDKQLLNNNDTGLSVRPYDKKDFKALVDYDTEAKGYRSEAYVSMMLDCFPTYVAVHNDDRLAGYVAAFSKREEIVLDGLCADSDSIACHLFRKVLDEFPTRNNVKLQVPTSRLFLSQLGVICSSSKYNRYSLGQPTPSPLVKIYNVSDCDYSY
ncbi:hypothetical protein BgiMline_002253 [Biomphalaria glabrata]|nr:GNAT family N-acetyltransferase [Biomphalaria glabrata]